MLPDEEPCQQPAAVVLLPRLRRLLEPWLAPHVDDGPADLVGLVVRVGGGLQDVGKVLGPDRRRRFPELREGRG
jgi:hypothetical protein